MGGGAWDGFELYGYWGVNRWEGTLLSIIVEAHVLVLEPGGLPPV